MLRKEDYAVIRSLSQRGVYLKDIAAELEVHPRTVSRALKRGSAPRPGPKRRGSKLDAFKARVDQLLLDGVWNSMVILREIQALGYTGGLALTWLRDALNGIPEIRMKDSGLSVDDLIASASQVPAGADGLLCLPFFAGERSPHWNMNARGVFFGLCLDHDARHMARALIEGVAYRLRSIRTALDDMGAEVNDIRASGGFTHSKLWLQIVSSVLGQSLAIPANGETSSLGAAFWALIGAGAAGRFEDLHPLVQVTDMYHPEPKDARLYDSLYGIYMEIYFQLAGAFGQMATIQDQLDPQKGRLVSTAGSAKSRTAS